jgi:hypothetical protein
MYKKMLFVILTLSIVTVAFASEQIIESFKATSSNDVVNIEWKTKSEINVSRFEIERNTTNGFKTIGSQQAKNKPSNYYFTDSDSFKKESLNDEFQSGNIKYRIKVVYSNSINPTYSNEIIVAQNVGSIKRTLGMIKEMFK